MTRPKLSRRDFLKGAGTGAVALAASSLLPCEATPTQASAGPANAEAWGILIDLTRCTGCNACVLACKEANGLPHSAEVAQTLSSDAYTCLNEYQVNSQAHYVKRQCMHCLQPACASACTVGALRKTPEGPVVYEANRCIGCRYCQYACPFGVPAYDWDNPLGLIHKCQMCVTRLAEGKSPACVSACPNGALRFGKRAELLAQARAQIASNPGRYVDHIYGEHEAGGTSVLYLASVPFSDLGFPTLGSEPISEKAETVMDYTPLTALTVASIAGALHWITGRRQKDSKGLRKLLGSSENDDLRIGGNDER